MKSGKTMVDKEEHSENRIVGMEGSKNATAEKSCAGFGTCK